MDLGSVRVSYVACFEHFRGAGDLRQGGADEAAGAAFGDRYPATDRSIGLDDLACLVDERLWEEGVAHWFHPIRMLAIACAAIPSPRPVKPRPSVVVAFTLTCSTLRPATSAILARIEFRWGPALGASAMIVQSM